MDNDRNKEKDNDKSKEEDKDQSGSSFPTTFESFLFGQTLQILVDFVESKTILNMRLSNNRPGHQSPGRSCLRLVAGTAQRIVNEMKHRKQKQNAR